MGNLALHSAEEPDDLRTTTCTVEVPTIRDNDAALALGARPIQQHVPAARHNGAQRVATANINGAPVYALHMAHSTVEHGGHLPHHDGSPSLFVPETPGGAARFTRQLFGAVEESPGMTPIIVKKLNSLIHLLTATATKTANIKKALLLSSTSRCSQCADK